MDNMIEYTIPFRTGQRLVELGGGTNPAIRPNVDFRAGPTVDIVADLSETLPLESNAFDGVYCSYALEHISWRKVRNFLNEVYRILCYNGVAVFVTANLREQARKLVETETWQDNEVCMVFGDQDYLPGNMHLCGFSPESVMIMLREAGFSDVLILPHPNTITDMIIEVRKATKPATNPNSWTIIERQWAYDSNYFNGGRKIGGYAADGYWDYPTNWSIYNKIKELNPKSVLELGPARGYILKRLEDSGVAVHGLDVSEHCYATRVVDSAITVWDITEAPWPMPDDSFDLCFSLSTLAHIPEDKLEVVFQEMKRTCRRGFHAIDVTDADGFDKTLTTIRDLKWWQDCLPEDHLAVDKESLVSEPVTPPMGDGKVKLNIGSFITMFHHGWLNIDIRDLEQWAKNYGYNFRKMDVTTGLGFADNSVDLIYTSHFLEHLNYQQGMGFLADCWRVMKPGATIRIAVPDAELLFKLYQEGKLSQFDQINDGCKNSPAQIAKLWSLLVPGHAAAYDSETLVDSLKATGFSQVTKCAFRYGNKQIQTETLDMCPDLSLYVEAVK